MTFGKILIKLFSCKKKNTGYFVATFNMLKKTLQEWFVAKIKKIRNSCPPVSSFLANCRL